MHYQKMSEDEKKSALELLMFMKEKRNGTVEGRGCADGQKRREGTESIETTSPTVATESVLLTAVIDALEERDVACVESRAHF